MWEQGTHLLHSKRSAWQIIQLRGPILKVWESYPNGHLPPVPAASATSFSAPLLSASAWFFLNEASSERTDFENGQAASDCGFLEEASSERPDFAKGQPDSPWCFREEASSGREDFTKGQTGVISILDRSPSKTSRIQSLSFQCNRNLKEFNRITTQRRRWNLKINALIRIENPQNYEDFFIQCRFPFRVGFPTTSLLKISSKAHEMYKWLNLRLTRHC